MMNDLFTYRNNGSDNTDDGNQCMLISILDHFRNFGRTPHTYNIQNFRRDLAKIKGLENFSILWPSNQEFDNEKRNHSRILITIMRHWHLNIFEHSPELNKDGKFIPNSGSSLYAECLYRIGKLKHGESARIPRTWTMVKILSTGRHYELIHSNIYNAKVDAQVSKIRNHNEDIIRNIHNELMFTQHHLNQLLDLSKLKNNKDRYTSIIKTLTDRVNHYIDLLEKNEQTSTGIHKKDSSGTLGISYIPLSETFYDRLDKYFTEEIESLRTQAQAQHQTSSDISPEVLSLINKIEKIEQILKDINLERIKHPY